MAHEWIEERLAYLKSRGKAKNKKGLAEKLGIAPARITDILKGFRRIALSEVPLVADYLELTETEVLAFVSGGSIEPSELKNVDLVGEVQAGVWRKALKWDQGEWMPSPAAPVLGFERLHQFGLRVRGPSMDEFYPEGSTLVCVELIELGRDPRPGEHVVVVRRDPRSDLIEATVKELRQDQEGAYWLWPRSSHPDFQTPWRLKFLNKAAEENEDVRITALVIGAYTVRAIP